MKFRDRILNKLADSLKEYATKAPPSKEYDYVTNCEVNGDIKGAFLTVDCTTIKNLKDKSYKGLININDVLEKEFRNDDSSYKEIAFCDKDKVVCIYNSENNTYYEDVHESFERAEQRLYIRCTDIGYKMLKEYINQSSKYHKYIVSSDVIPQKKAFDKIFKEENLVEKAKNKSKKNKIYDNYIQITGKVSNIGKEFTKRDGEKAKFIEIQQEYEYNDKIKYNKISVMISNKLINEICNISKESVISVKGKLNTYNDKNDNIKSVINCTEISTLDLTKEYDEKER